MSRMGRFAPLYCMAEVRETTRRLRFLASAVMSSSVMPSAKYSCEESPERLASGITAMEWIWAAWFLGKRRARNSKAKVAAAARQRTRAAIILLFLAEAGLGAVAGITGLWHATPTPPDPSTWLRAGFRG